MLISKLTEKLVQLGFNSKSNRFLKFELNGFVNNQTFKLNIIKQI